jgi:hypothetical protein
MANSSSAQEGTPGTGVQARPEREKKTLLLLYICYATILISFSVKERGAVITAPLEGIGQEDSEDVLPGEVGIVEVEVEHHGGAQLPKLSQVHLGQLRLVHGKHVTGGRVGQIAEI